MSEYRTIRALGIEAPGRLYLWNYDEAPPNDGQVRLETLYSGFSAGTELTFVKGTNPYLSARWDEDHGLFVPGQPAIAYPVAFAGYMEVGRVVESRTGDVRTGTVVGTTYGHKTGHTLDPQIEPFASLPNNLDPILGIYVGQMGPICANGLLHAAAELFGTNVQSLGDGVRGRTVLVTGAGVVGLLTALFARRHGAMHVLLSDPSPFRRERAAALGFEAVDESGVGRLCKERWGDGAGRDRGVDTAFQCRAQASSLHEALRALRPQGAVIDLAFYQGGADALRLGEEFHHNGLNIRCAQIGRVPRGLGHLWNRRRLTAETIELLFGEGPAIREHVITDVIPFEDAPAFVESLARDRRDFLQVVFQA
jgi:NADPH:quinone reductase-like Zn-dependent oxidoreductase